MAKMSRNGLKKLVKECLLEILSEGIGSTPSAAPSNTRRAQKKRPAQKQQRLPRDTVRFDSAVQETVESITGDSMMQQILAETARTTLQEQNKYEGNGVQSANPTPEMLSGNGTAGIDLSGVFEGASENWSSLAFAEKKNKLSNN